MKEILKPFDGVESIVDSVRLESLLGIHDFKPFTKWLYDGYTI